MADDTTIRTKIVVEGEAQYKAAMADIGRQLKETKSALSMAAAEYQNADAATRNSATQVDALTQSLEQQQQRLALMAENLAEQIGPAIDATASAISEAAGEIDEKMSELSEGVSERFYGGAEKNVDEAAAEATAQRWIDVLRGSVDSAAAQGESSAALAGMLDGMLPDDSALSESMKRYAERHKAAVVAQMETAYGQESDEDFEAWKRFQQSMIDSAYEDNMEDAAQLGEDTAGAAMDAIDAQGPQMQATGGELGQRGVTGLTDGLSGMSGAARDTLDGVLGVLASGQEAAYAAGYATGSAYERGYKKALDQHSPSRVMARAAQDTDEGALEQYERDRRQFEEAGQTLAAALAGGFARAGNPARAGADGAPGPAIDYGALSQAVAEAIAASGIGIYIDKSRLAALCEPAFSRNTLLRAGATIQGRAADVKGW